MYTIRVSNGLDPDQARRFVGPDLGPNSLQLLSADDTCRLSVNKIQRLQRKEDIHIKDTIHNHRLKSNQSDQRLFQTV